MMSSKTCDMIFSTDMYYPDSVKSMERCRRGSAHKLIIKGANTKKPKCWKEFLSNDENKHQLIKLMLSIWQTNLTASHLTNRSPILICEEEAFHLHSTDGRNTNSPKVSELKSLQEETDTCVILYCMYAKQKGYKNILCMHYAKTELQGLNVFIDIGNGKNRRLIDVTGYASSLSIERCSALLGLHAFIQCDSTSCFKGIGKIKPMKVLDKNDHFELPLSQIGRTVSVSADLEVKLEQFVCLLYSRKLPKDTNELRLSILQEKYGGDKTEIK